jgi:hypothetical protein
MCIVTWLPTWITASSTRQAPENTLPKLNQQQFEHLMRDVMREIDRRFPDLSKTQVRPRNSGGIEI